MSEKVGFFKRIKGIKNIEIIIALVLAALVLLVFFGNFREKSTKQTSAEYSFSEYVNSVESKLKLALSKITGAGNVDIVISFASGIEQEYAYTTETVKNGSTTTEKHTLTLVSGKPVLIKETAPKILGIIIVAEGGGSTTVKLEIIRAVQALFEVPNGKIEVFKRA